MEHVEEISCIKDGITGVCRDIKDKTARADLTEVKEKLNEVINTVNALTGVDGGHLATDDDIIAIQREIDKLEETIDNIDISGGGVSQETVDKILNNTDIIQSDSTKGSFYAGVSKPSARATNSIVIGNSSYLVLPSSQKNVVLVGPYSNSSSSNTVVIGSSASTGAENSTAIGYNARALSTKSIQLGQGTNSVPNTLQVFNDNIYNHETHTLTVENIELNGQPLVNNGPRFETATYMFDTASKSVTGITASDPLAKEGFSYITTINTGAITYNQHDSLTTSFINFTNFNITREFAEGGSTTYADMLSYGDYWSLSVAGSNFRTGNEIKDSIRLDKNGEKYLCSYTYGSDNKMYVTIYSTTDLTNVNLLALRVDTLKLGGD